MQEVLKDLMEKSITSIVSQYLNQVEPDRFYTRFFQCNKKMNEKIWTIHKI